MNRELEALLKSYQAWKEAYDSGAKSDDLFSLYDSRLEQVIVRRPNLSKETLHRSVQKRYLGWLHAQDKPPSMPPKA